MENGIPKEKYIAYKETFDMFDRNGDKKICVRELDRAMRSLGQNPTNAEVKEIIRSADIDEDGFLDLNEFITVMEENSKHVSFEEEMKDAFAVFDKDGNGLISVDELKYAMINLGEKLTQEEVEEMLTMADIDGDGHLNYGEFVTAMAQNDSQQEC